MSERFDVVVIGGGTAGLVTASGSARLGRRVALIERKRLGGDCLWTGCVPTKALVATAKLAHQMRHAAAWGLPSHEATIDGRAVMESMRAARHLVSHHDDPARFRELGIEVLEQTEARLSGDGRVRAGDRELTARDIVVATGSRTAVPPIPGLEESGYLDHVSFLAGDRIPGSVLILGGGAIGVEFAQILRRLGSEVTIVEMAADIVGNEDPDVIAALRSTLASEGITIRTEWTVDNVRAEGSGKVASLRSAAGSLHEERAEEIFLATGRRGNVEDLGLEAAGVGIRRSYVEVDAFLATTAPRVWACGDVTGRMQFTHAAAFEAVKLVRNMLFPGRARVTYDHVPWAIYTDPEVAHVGWTEPEARARLGESAVRTYRADMSEVDRAIVDRATGGFVKIISDPKGRIVGAHAFCTNASALIGQIVLARKKGARVGDLAQLVGPYPSLADSIQKAASGYYQNLARGPLAALARRIAGWSQ